MVCRKYQTISRGCPRAEKEEEENPVWENSETPAGPNVCLIFHGQHIQERLQDREMGGGGAVIEQQENTKKVQKSQFNMNPYKQLPQKIQTL